MRRPSTLRRNIRHLKRGVFPPDHVSEFTCGRVSELAEIRTIVGEVARGSSRAIVVEGAYGSGKSHLLKAIEGEACREGMAVAWVTLDGYQHAFNHPTRYLHSLFESLRLPDVPYRGMASLTEHWMRIGMGRELVDIAQHYAKWLYWPLAMLQRGDTTEGVRPWIHAKIECRDLITKNGKAWYPEVSNRLEGLAKLAHAAGYNGVVFLFDELETVATQLITIRQRLLSYEFLKLLFDARRHLRCCFVMAATPDFGNAAMWDRDRRGEYQRDYPDAFRLLDKWHEGAIPRVALEPLRKQDLIALCFILRNSHQQAFEWDARQSFSDDFVRNYVAKAERYGFGTRDIARAFTNLLELVEQNPGVDLASIRAFSGLSDP